MVIYDLQKKISEKPINTVFVPVPNIDNYYRSLFSRKRFNFLPFEILIKIRDFQRNLYGEFSAVRVDVIFWRELYPWVNQNIFLLNGNNDNS